MYLKYFLSGSAPLRESYPISFFFFNICNYILDPAAAGELFDHWKVYHVLF